MQEQINSPILDALDKFYESFSDLEKEQFQYDIAK